MQFHEIFFWPNSIFCNSKNGQKSIFEVGKLPKMQFREKKNRFKKKNYFTIFFAWTFLNFLVHCASFSNKTILQYIDYQ